MIVAIDSPLRLVSPTTEIRTVLFLDGIRYSVEILDLAFRRLEATLGKIEALKNDGPELAELIPEAMANAWTMVDSANRLRDLIEQMPGLKKNETEVQLFKRNTETVDLLRNFVQHFPTGIADFVGKQMPLWGLLSWVPFQQDPGSAQSLTIVSGTSYPGLKAYSLTYDRQVGRFLGRVVLTVGDYQIDLADLFDRVVKFLAWFENWCRNTFGTHGHHAADLVIRAIFTPEDQ